MPEGDTVWLAAQGLDAALAGRRLERAELRVPRLATVDLAGLTVERVMPRGKHLLFRLNDGRSLRTHFRMEGAFRLYPIGAPWRGGADHQVRVVLATASVVAVGYRLGIVELTGSAAADAALSSLGPDVLGPGWDPDLAVANLLARPRRQVGAALLDQRVLAGLGNIWRTEACFLASVSPWTPVAELADPRRLVEIGAQLVRANTGMRANTVRADTGMRADTGRPEQISTGSARRGDAYWIYGRAGRPCRRCGTTIRRADQAHDAGEPSAAAPVRRIATGATRNTAWCPRCQPGPGPGPTRGPGVGGAGVGGAGSARPRG